MQISRFKEDGQLVVKTLVKGLASSEFWRRLVESLQSKGHFSFWKGTFCQTFFWNCCFWMRAFPGQLSALLLFSKRKTNLSNLKASDAALLWKKQGPLCVWPSTALKQKREKTWTWVDEAKLFFYFSTTKTIPYHSLRYFFFCLLTLEAILEIGYNPGKP